MVKNKGDVLMSNLSTLSTNLKAVFFDLDDTLVFSERRHNQAWKELLTELGIDTSAIDFQAMVGIADLTQAEHFIKQFNIPETAESVCERKRNIFLSLSSNGFESALGRNAFLESLSQSCILGVVSSSATGVIKRVLDLEKITHFFSFVIGHEDCSKHKPDPLPYEKALGLAKVKPEQALVIEDSVSGITSALKAAIPVVGLLKDQRPEQIVHSVSYFSTFDEISQKIFRG